MKTRSKLAGFTKSQFHTQDLAQGIISLRASEFCSQRTMRHSGTAAQRHSGTAAQRHSGTGLKLFNHFLLVMVITVTSFLGTSRLMANDCCSDNGIPGTSSSATLTVGPCKVDVSFCCSPGSFGVPTITICDILVHGPNNPGNLFCPPSAWLYMQIADELIKNYNCYGVASCPYPACDVVQAYNVRMPCFASVFIGPPPDNKACYIACGYDCQLLYTVCCNALGKVEIRSKCRIVRTETINGVEVDIESCPPPASTCTYPICPKETEITFCRVHTENSISKQVKDISKK